MIRIAQTMHHLVFLLVTISEILEACLYSANYFRFLIHNPVGPVVTIQSDSKSGDSSGSSSSNVGIIEYKHLDQYWLLQKLQLLKSYLLYYKTRLGQLFPRSNVRSTSVAARIDTFNLNNGFENGGHFGPLLALCWLATFLVNRSYIWNHHRGRKLPSNHRYRLSFVEADHLSQLFLLKKTLRKPRR